MLPTVQVVNLGYYSPDGSSVPDVIYLAPYGVESSIRIMLNLDGEGAVYLATLVIDLPNGGTDFWYLTKDPFGFEFS